jgi:hypothetical protein
MKTFAQAAGLPGFQQSKTYAAHRVWAGSTRATIKTQPLPFKDAWRLYKEARRFERQTRGHMASHYARGLSRRDGRLGKSGLVVLQSLLFDFLDHKTGRLDPSYYGLRQKTGLSLATIGRALARLREAGVLNWVKRCAEAMEPGEAGGFLLRQISNLYAVAPASQWRGYARAPEAPPPDPESTGAHPPMAALGVAAGDGARRMKTILEGSPPGSLGEALARLTKRRIP